MTLAVGKLTALHGSAVAMTVAAHFIENSEEGEITHVNVQWFDSRNRLQSQTLPEDMFIGFGDNLVFAGGAFITAYDDEDEDEEGDDEGNPENSPANV